MSEFKAKFQISGRIEEILDLQTFSSGFTKRDIVVQTSKNEQYPSPVKVTFKKDDCDKVETLCIGDCVDIEGFVNGRPWDGPKGRQYFIDLEVKSVMVTEKADPGEKPTKASDWTTLLALGKAWGKNDEQVKDCCRKHGVPFAEMKPEDWQAIADGIVKECGGSSSEEAGEDDLPF